MASAVVTRNKPVHDVYDAELAAFEAKRPGSTLTQPIDPTVVYTSVDFTVADNAASCTQNFDVAPYIAGEVVDGDAKASCKTLERPVRVLVRNGPTAPQGLGWRIEANATGGGGWIPTRVMRQGLADIVHAIYFEPSIPSSPSCPS
jgi:hypothetical protein